MWKIGPVQSAANANGEDPHGFNITNAGGKPLVSFAYATLAKAEGAAAQMRLVIEDAVEVPTSRAVMPVAAQRCVVGVARLKRSHTSKCGGGRLQHRLKARSHCSRSCSSCNALCVTSTSPCVPQGRLLASTSAASCDARADRLKIVAWDGSGASHAAADANVWYCLSQAFREGFAMDDHQIGWIAAIIIGGIAGWLAEQFMKSQMGLVMNIVLGIIGAAVASWLLGFLGINLGGWIGYLIPGFIGACILIAIARAFSGGFQRRT